MKLILSFLAMLIMAPILPAQDPTCFGCQWYEGNPIVQSPNVVSYDFAVAPGDDLNGDCQYSFEELDCTADPCVGQLVCTFDLQNVLILDEYYINHWHLGQWKQSEKQIPGVAGEATVAITVMFGIACGGDSTVKLEYGQTIPHMGWAYVGKIFEIKIHCLICERLF